MLGLDFHAYKDMKILNREFLVFEISHYVRNDKDTLM